jgi:hypothetical protein
MKGTLFKKKDIKDFTKSVREIFNLLTISRKYTVIGSGALEDVKYSADYDLNELFQRPMDTDEALDEIYKMFKNKFAEAEKDKATFITDFKCGEDSDGEPLRWKKEDIKRGTKELKDGRTIRFQNCILMKATMKMDMIVLIEERFVEFSDNYLVKLGDEANFFPHDISRDHILNSIRHSYDEYFYTKANFFKGLKRAFAWYLMKDERKYKTELKGLMDFFNSPVGFIYKKYNNIDAVILVLEQTFKKPNIQDVKNNIELIIACLVERMFHHGEINGIIKLLEDANKSKSVAKMLDYLYKAKDGLTEIVNRYTLEFVLKNKNLPLY